MKRLWRLGAKLGRAMWPDQYRPILCHLIDVAAVAHALWDEAFRPPFRRRLPISVALVIGRFAAGQARPLESVIIDEGFGSLDRDGLRAAADELNRLRQHLRRIVVVSHQEDFARRFPVVIQLSHGENGATAVAVRQ